MSFPASAAAPGESPAEEAVRRLKERYRALAQATAAIVWTTAADGSVSEPMQGWKEFTGQTWEAERGMGWTAAIHPDDRPAAMRSWRDAVRGRRELRQEHRVRRADGEWRWMASRGVPLLDAHGEIYEWIGTLVDVTDRHLADAALARSEERYRTLIASAASIVWSAAADGGTVPDSTPAAGWEEFTGVPAEQSRGDRWLAQIHPEDRPDATDAWTKALASGKPLHMEYRLRRHDGEWRQVSVRGFPLRGPDGTVREWIGTISDIHERRAAEEALRESEARRRFALEAAEIGEWELDLSGGQAERSLRHDQIFGYPDRLPEWTYERFLEHVHPEDHADVDDGFRHALATAGAWDFECRIRRADGAERWVWGYGAHRLDESGRPTRMVGLMLDITARKQSEEALRAQTDALREADRRKDEFLAMLAHELRNPLASVGNAVSLLRTDASEEHRAWAAGVLERQTAQLARLIDDLLDVSRITRGKIALRRECLSIAAALDHAAVSVRPLMQERGHELVCDYPRGSLWVEADPTRLEQIVLNVLSNAAKYTPPGGRIELRAARSGPDVTIDVRDNGLGLTAEQATSMFELFAQGERTAARTEGGLGIGLTVARKLAELHGGSVSAASEGAGRGSTFTVRLPAASAPEVPPTSAPIAAPSPASPASPLRVLVVDDNEDTAHGLRRLLMRDKHEVRLAHDGPAALDAAREFSPQVVLLDIGLPGMDGYEVAARLRADAASGAAGARIAAVSGYGQDEDRRRSQEAGFDRHFVKPLPLSDLRAFLAEAAAMPEGRTTD